jgi:hypothetical protein
MIIDVPVTGTGYALAILGRAIACDLNRADPGTFKCQTGKKEIESD